MKSLSSDMHLIEARGEVGRWGTCTQECAYEQQMTSLSVKHLKTQGPREGGERDPDDDDDDVDDDDKSMDAWVGRAKLTLRPLVPPRIWPRKRKKKQEINILSPNRHHLLPGCSDARFPGDSPFLLNDAKPLQFANQAPVSGNKVARRVFIYTSSVS